MISAKNVLLPRTTRFGYGTSHPRAGHGSNCWKISMLHFTTIKHQKSTHSRFDTKRSRYDYVIWWQGCYYAPQLVAWSYVVEDFAGNLIQRQLVSSSNLIVGHHIELIDDQSSSTSSQNLPQQGRPAFQRYLARFS